MSYIFTLVELAKLLCRPRVRLRARLPGLLWALVWWCRRLVSCRLRVRMVWACCWWVWRPLLSALGFVGCVAGNSGGWWRPR